MKNIILSVLLGIIVIQLSILNLNAQEITKLKDIIPTGTNARFSGDEFGYHIAVDGDILIVGAFRHGYDSAGTNFVSQAGAVFIFGRNIGGTNNWGLIKKITPVGTNARMVNDAFGYSVAISGDNLVVGAAGQDYDANGQNYLRSTGAVFVFNRNEGGTDNWGQVKKIVPTGTNARMADDRFGHFVAIDGANLVVGVYEHDYDADGLNPLNDVGACFVYNKDAGGVNNWGQVKKIVPTGTNNRCAGDLFGYTVAIDGNNIVVGSAGQDFDTNGTDSVFGAGACFIYNKDEGGLNNWGQVKKIVPTGTNARIWGDSFGYTVAMDNDNIVIGAHGQDFDANGQNKVPVAGAAYIFGQDEGGLNNWGQQKKIAAEGMNARAVADYFSYAAVAIDGDNIVIGAYIQDYDASGGDSVYNAGAVYVFNKHKGGANNWGQTEKLVGTGNNNRNSEDYFGYSTSVSNNTIVVGTFQQDYDTSGSNYLEDAGKVTVYSYDSSLICTNSVWSIAPNNGTESYAATVISGTCEIDSGSKVRSLDVRSGAITFVANGTVIVNESFTNNGTINGSGSITLGGTSSQTIFGTGITNNLVLDNSSGASISDSLKITGVYTHTSGTLTTNGKLVLKATDFVTYGQIAGIGSGNVSGDVIAEYIIPSVRYLSWIPISSPFSNTTLAALEDDVTINFSPNTNVYKFDEKRVGLGAWKGVTSGSQSLDTNGVSICLFDSNGVTIDVSGTYIKGDYTTIPLSKTGSIADTSGWHILKNPWPSNYNHTTTINNLVSNTIYVYEGNVARDWNGTTGSLANGVVPPFHGIYVLINSHNNTLTFPNANRTTLNSNNLFDKKGLENYVAVKVRNQQGIWDETRIYQDSKAQNNYDFYDALKRKNGIGAPTIYTKVEDNDISINLIKNIPATGISFPLQFRAYEKGSYTLNFTLDNIENCVEVVLEDLITNTQHKTTEGEYKFNYDPTTTTAQRFVLHYQRKSNTTIVEELNNENVFVSSYNQQIQLNFSNAGTYDITVYDLMGRKLHQSKTITNGGTIENISLSGKATGYYVVKVRNQNAQKTFKVFLN